MLLIQILIVLFVLLAAAVVVRRSLRGEIRLLQAAGWLALWAAVAVAVLIPRTTETLARALGVGRGVDVVLYLSVVFLFYMQFRTLLRLERMERSITAAVRAAALRDFMEDERKRPLIVLMHGDRQVSTKELARAIGAKSVTPCSPETANRHSGYVVGGISPFGTRHPMPVFIEETILGLPKIYINGGRRGFLVGMRPEDVVRVLSPVPVRVAI